MHLSTMKIIISKLLVDSSLTINAATYYMGHHIGLSHHRPTCCAQICIKSDQIDSLAAHTRNPRRRML